MLIMDIMSLGKIALMHKLYGNAIEHARDKRKKKLITYVGKQ